MFLTINDLKLTIYELKIASKAGSPLNWVTFYRGNQIYDYTFIE